VAETNPVIAVAKKSIKSVVDQFKRLFSADRCLPRNGRKKAGDLIRRVVAQCISKACCPTSYEKLSLKQKELLESKYVLIRSDESRVTVDADVTLQLLPRWCPKLLTKKI